MNAVEFWFIKLICISFLKSGSIMFAVACMLCLNDNVHCGASLVYVPLDVSMVIPVGIFAIPLLGDISIG